MARLDCLIDVCWTVYHVFIIIVNEIKIIYLIQHRLRDLTLQMQTPKLSCTSSPSNRLRKFVPLYPRTEYIRLQNKLQPTFQCMTIMIIQEEQGNKIIDECITAIVVLIIV